MQNPSTFEDSFRVAQDMRSTDHFSATAGSSSRGAAPGQYSHFPNHNIYGGGQYYAHATPQRASNIVPPRGQYFIRGQHVHVQANGTTMLLNAVVWQDATPRDPTVYIQTNHDGQLRSIPNDPDFIKPLH